MKNGDEQQRRPGDQGYSAGNVVQSDSADLLIVNCWS